MNFNPRINQVDDVTTRPRHNNLVESRLAQEKLRRNSYKSVLIFNALALVITCLLLAFGEEEREQIKKEHKRLWQFLMANTVIIILDIKFYGVICMLAKDSTVITCHVTTM